MPKRKDIKKILVVGAGPIIIGQACEFDYSGTQACKALKDEGYKVILINSNPATIMTDPDVADKTYIEPITLEVLEKIIKKEKPDAILPTMGGQTALNLAMEAEKKGILKKYKIKLIGAKSEAIANAEDRKKFRKNMIDIGLDLPKSKIIKKYIPIMNTLINQYLQSMDFFVSFNLDEEFNETVKSRFRDTFNYNNFSEGEKMRIDLALLFTWRAIAKMKNSTNTNLLVLDEIFDSSLDGQGTDDFFKILKDLTKENIFIISHKGDILFDRFTNIIKFEKEHNFTKIGQV